MVSDCRMHIVSDSLGDTAAAVVAAAASQFPELRDAPIGRLSHLRDPAQVDAYLEAALSFGHGIVVFHTITDPGLRAALVRGARSRGIREVDLLGPSIEALSGMLGVEPIDVPGVLHEIDRGYFARIEAMEFAVSHDDGRNEHDLAAADIVHVLEFLQHTAEALSFARQVNFIALLHCLYACRPLDTARGTYAVRSGYRLHIAIDNHLFHRLSIHENSLHPLKLHSIF